jgi:RES domain-containing protein
VILWRISNFASLDGKGGLVAPGRWHSKGRLIVYLADSSALAMHETLVHYEIKEIPGPFQLLRIEAPDKVPFTEWQSAKSAADVEATRAWGDAWLADGKTALARVPSVIAPQAFNWLLNPAHDLSGQVRITEKSRWPWDQRLFRS